MRLWDSSERRPCACGSLISRLGVDSCGGNDTDIYYTIRWCFVEIAFNLQNKYSNSNCSLSPTREDRSPNTVKDLQKRLIHRIFNDYLAILHLIYTGYQNNFKQIQKQKPSINRSTTQTFKPTNPPFYHRHISLSSSPLPLNLTPPPIIRPVRLLLRHQARLRKHRHQVPINLRLR